MLRNFLNYANLQHTNRKSLTMLFAKYAHNTSAAAPGESKRLADFRKKLRETTDITDLGEQSETKKEDPLPPWPENTNPHTGEVGGPRGPEPTRYGDWERKGRVTDF